VTNEYNQFIDITRDNVGRVLQTRYTNWADLEKQTFSYDAYDRVKTLADALGNTTTYSFDNAGRMTQSTGPAVNGSAVTTSYAYDTPGNLVSLTDAGGNTTTFEYDKRGRMRFERITVSGTQLSQEYQYYLNNTLQWYKDRDFNWREYKYNFVMGGYQIAQERWWKTGVNYFQDINYQYNDPKGLLLTDVFERSPGTTQVNNHIEFTYDGLARATKVRTFLSGNGAVAAQGGVAAVAASAVSSTFDVDHTWDALDRRDKSEFYFNDQTGTLKQHEFRNDYTFDKLHRLTSIVQDVSSAATTWTIDAARKRNVTFEYYANSQLKKITRTQGTNTTGLITDYTQNGADYDNQVPGRVSNVVHSGLTSGSQTTSYDFDLAGRIIQKNTSGPQSYNYQYDGTDQLSLVTSASGGGGTVLQDPNFNGIGNDTGHTVSQHNRVTNDGTYSYEYNNEGSRTKRTKLSDGSYEVYAYDHRQRLVSVKAFTVANVETSDVRYDYDALDRRIRRKADTNNNDTVFEVSDRLLYDTNPVTSAPSLLPRLGGEGTERT